MADTPNATRGGELWHRMCLEIAEDPNQPGVVDYERLQQVLIGDLEWYIAAPRPEIVCTGYDVEGRIKLAVVKAGQLIPCEDVPEDQDTLDIRQYMSELLDLYSRN